MMGAIFQMHSSTTEMEVRRQDLQLVAEFQMRMKGKLISDTITFFLQNHQLAIYIRGAAFSQNTAPAPQQHHQDANNYR